MSNYIMLMLLTFGILYSEGELDNKPIGSAGVMCILTAPVCLGFIYTFNVRKK